jgi:hypothetical protein
MAKSWQAALQPRARFAAEVEWRPIKVKKALTGMDFAKHTLKLRNCRTTSSPLFSLWKKAGNADGFAREKDGSMVAGRHAA